MKKIQRVKGTEDRLPQDIDKWKYIESVFYEVCRVFGFSEIRTPMFESTDLFRRGVGETTDIVQKEMFNIEQKKEVENAEESLSLKPEGTAPVVRAFIENSLYAGPQPTKLYYDTPCFRYEKPQKGRLRQFHQFGVEVFSSDSAFTDAEVIALAYTFFKRLGIEKEVQLKINSVGTPKSRKTYADTLRMFYKPKLEHLCVHCQQRYEKNPMRIIDCKEDNCKKLSDGVPLILDHLDEESREHFEALQQYLDLMQVPYVIDPYIVRGLDYYVKTAFEFVTDHIGAQATVCGGGRYDGLVEQLSGPVTPGIGFGLGKERLLLLLEQLSTQIPERKPMDLFLIPLSDEAKSIAIKALHTLRLEGVSCEIDSLNRSIKAQMKYANKLNSQYVAIIGEDEIKNSVITLKNMANSTQVSVSIDRFVEDFMNLRG